jgi:hypothetical protein
MGTYTYFVEKDGATLIEQFEARSSKNAVAAWYASSETDPGPLPEPPDDEATPITGRERVWCFSGLDRSNVFFSVHFVGPLRRSGT